MVSRWKEVATLSLLYTWVADLDYAMKVLGSGSSGIGLVSNSRSAMEKSTGVGSGLCKVGGTVLVGFQA